MITIILNDVKKIKKILNFNSKIIIQDFLKFFNENWRTIFFSIFVFLIFYLFYFTLGILISRVNGALTLNVLFGTDSARVIEDLTSFNSKTMNYYNYRSAVHPLFILFFNPLSILLMQFGLNSTQIAILINSFFGACLVALFYCFCIKLKLNFLFSFLLTLILGCSTTSFFFSAVPETFIFGSFSLLLTIFLLARYNSFKKNNFILLLILSGIFVFGITITNFIIWLILVFFKFFFEINFKKTVPFLYGILAIILMTCVFLSIIQKVLYPYSLPFFLIYPFFHETKYVSTNIFSSQEKIILSEISVFSICSFYAPTIQKEEEGRQLHLNEFDYSLIDSIPIFILIFLITSSLYNALTSRNFLIYGILLSLCFNFFLHMFYGAGQPFIYSAHVHILLMCLLPFFMVKWQKKRFKFWLLVIILSGFLIFQISNNYIFISTILNNRF